VAELRNVCIQSCVYVYGYTHTHVPAPTPTRCYSIAPAQRIQEYIWGYICGGESEREAPYAGVRCIYGITWDYICGGREGQRDGGGECREENTCNYRQNHSTAQHSSNPLDSTVNQSIDTTSKKYLPEKIQVKLSEDVHSVYLVSDLGGSDNGDPLNGIVYCYCLSCE
jgi:hypothetical protein